MTKAASPKQKQAWEELHHQLLSGTFLSALDAVIAIDSKQRIVLFNPAAERMFLVRAQEAVGQSLARFIPQGLRAAHGKNLQRFPKTGRTGRQIESLGIVRGLRANGSEFPAEASVSRVQAGGRQFFAALVRDISKRVQAEQLLQESSERLRLAVDTARLGTYERDLVTNRITLNEACRAILDLPEGPPPDDIARRSAHPEDKERVLAAVARAFDPTLREVCAAEFRILRPDGTVRWVSGRGRVVFDDTATPARARKFLG